VNLRGRPPSERRSPRHTYLRGTIFDAGTSLSSSGHQWDDSIPCHLRPGTPSPARINSDYSHTLTGADGAHCHGIQHSVPENVPSSSWSDSDSQPGTFSFLRSFYQVLVQHLVVVAPWPSSCSYCLLRGSPTRCCGEGTDSALTPPSASTAMAIF
jgi:hypothetical protein